MTSQYITEPPEYKLYSVASVCIATFLGGCLAGGLLMSINCLRLREPKRAVVIMVISFVVLFLNLLSQVNIFPDFLSKKMGFSSVLLFMVWAFVSQEKLLNVHVKENGCTESVWKVLGMSILFMFVVGCISAFFVFFLSLF